MKKNVLLIEKRLSQLMYLLCGIVVMATIFLAVGNVVGRYWFGTSAEWAEEIIRYLIIFAATTGSAPMIAEGTHICMSLLQDNIKNEKFHLVYDYVSNISILILCLFLTKWSIQLVSVTNMKTYSLLFWMQDVYKILIFGFSIISVFCILKIIIAILNTPGVFKRKVSEIK